MVTYACNPSYLETEIRRIVVQSQLQQNKSQAPSSKIPSTKTGLAEWLSCKCEALNSNPSTTKKKKDFLKKVYLIKIICDLRYKCKQFKVFPSLISQILPFFTVFNEMVNDLMQKVIYERSFEIIIG
jgi:hypothetical protein